MCHCEWQVLDCLGNPSGQQSCKNTKVVKVDTWFHFFAVLLFIYFYLYKGTYGLKDWKFMEPFDLLWKCYSILFSMFFSKYNRRKSYINIIDLVRTQHFKKSTNQLAKKIQISLQSLWKALKMILKPSHAIHRNINVNKCMINTLLFEWLLDYIMLIQCFPGIRF